MKNQKSQTAHPAPHKNTRTRTLLISAAFLCCLLFAYLIVRNLPESGTSSDTTDAASPVTVFSLNSKTLTALSYTRDGTTLSFTHDEEQDCWVWEENKSLPISDQAIESLISVLGSVTSSVRVAADNPASFGLDDPALTVSVTDGAGTRTLSVGIQNSYNGLYYCKSSQQEGIYMIPKSLPSSFFTSISAFVDSVSFPEVLADKIKTIVVSVGSSTVTYTYHQNGVEVDGTLSFWSRTESRSEEIRWLNEEDDIRLSRFVTDFVFPAPTLFRAEELEEHGIGEEPCGKITVTYITQIQAETAPAVDGDDNTFVLSIGLPAEDGTGYYIAYENIGFLSKDETLLSLLTDAS